MRLEYRENSNPELFSGFVNADWTNWKVLSIGIGNLQQGIIFCFTIVQYHDVPQRHSTLPYACS